MTEEIIKYPLYLDAPVKKAFTVLDKKTNLYKEPFFVHSNGEAIRSFSNLVNSKGESLVSMYPEDFELYEIGVYEYGTAILVKKDNFVYLGCGLDFLEEKK